MDDEGRATARGRALTAVGVHPRLARALLDGAPLVGRRRAAEVVALLSGDTSVPQRRSRRRLARACATARTAAPPPAGGRRWPGSSVPPRTPPAPRLPDDTAAGLVVGLAHPERLARRRPGSTGTYLMAAGTGAELAPGTALSGAAWLAIAVADRSPGRRDARVRSAVAIDEATALEAGRRAARGARRGDLARRRRVQRPRVERLGAIVLAERPLPDPDPADVAARRRRGPAPRGARAAALDAGGAPAAGPPGRGARRTR